MKYAILETNHQSINDFHPRFKDGSNSILDGHLRESPKIESHHICSDFL